MDNIILYNHFHNGDLHYSKWFIELFFNNQPITYLHSQKKGIYKLYPNVIEGEINNNCKQNSFIYEIDNTVYINTWIGCNNRQYLKGCNVYTNYRMLEELCRYFSLENRYVVSDLVPTNIGMFDIDFVKNNNKLNILISNGDVHSGQANNFDFNPIIKNLSDKHSNVNFILTQKRCLEKLNNVYYTEDIINLGFPDLNEIGYLSTFCDIIIGRSSGPYCFTHNKQNFLDVNKTYISFCDSYLDGTWFFDDDIIKSKILWSNCFETNYVIKYIDNVINDKLCQ